MWESNNLFSLARQLLIHEFQYLAKFGEKGQMEVSESNEVVI